MYTKEIKQFTKGESDAKYSLSYFKSNTMYLESLVLDLDNLKVGESVDCKGIRYTRVDRLISSKHGPIVQNPKCYVCNIPISHEWLDGDHSLLLCNNKDCWVKDGQIQDQNENN